MDNITEVTINNKYLIVILVSLVCFHDTALYRPPGAEQHIFAISVLKKCFY